MTNQPAEDQDFSSLYEREEEISDEEGERQFMLSQSGYRELTEDEMYIYGIR